MPVIGVLALQGDVREHARALEGAGATARPVRRLSEIEAVDGLNDYPFNDADRASINRETALRLMPHLAG